MQQQQRPSVLQNVLLALQRMAGFQRQVHRPTAENRQNRGEQRGAFRQTNAYYPRLRMLVEQGLQTLLDRLAMRMQLSIADRLLSEVQRRPIGVANQALLQTLDQRNLRLFQQRGVHCGVKAMDVGKAVEKLQVFQPLEIRRRHRCGIPQVFRVAGVAADQQRHFVHHVHQHPLAQCLPVAGRLIANRHAADQCRAEKAQQVDRRQTCIAMRNNTQTQMQVWDRAEVAGRDEAIVNDQIHCRFRCAAAIQ